MLSTLAIDSKSLKKPWLHDRFSGSVKVVNCSFNAFEINNHHNYDGTLRFAILKLSENDLVYVYVFEYVAFSFFPGGKMFQIPRRFF